MAKAKMIRWGEKKKPFAKMIDENTLEIKLKKKKYIITGNDFGILGIDLQDNTEQSIMVEDGALDEQGLTIEEVEVSDDEEEQELDKDGKPISTDDPDGDAGAGDATNNGAGGGSGNGNPDLNNPGGSGGKPDPSGKAGPGQRGGKPDGEGRQYSRRIDPRQKLDKLKPSGNGGSGKEE